MLQWHPPPRAHVGTCGVGDRPGKTRVVENGEEDDGSQPDHKSLGAGSHVELSPSSPARTIIPQKQPQQVPLQPLHEEDMLSTHREADLGSRRQIFFILGVGPASGATTGGDPHGGGLWVVGWPQDLSLGFGPTSFHVLAGPHGLQFLA